MKAWLSFADKKEYRDQAIAGARNLDNRTTDAVEMLLDRSDISAPWKVLKYLPVLDLEPTLPLCREALTQVRGDLDKVLSPEGGRSAALSRIARHGWASMSRSRH